MSLQASLRRAAQQQQVRSLYRRSLKNALDWAIYRDIFYKQADILRQEFEAFRHETDVDRIDRLIAAGEARLLQNIHPDPYIVPWAYGGSKYARNPPLPSGISVVSGFGAEEH